MDVSNSKHVLVGSSPYGGAGATCSCAPLQSQGFDGSPGLNVFLSVARSGNTIMLEITRTGNDQRPVGAPVLVILRGDVADVYQEIVGAEALRHARSIIEHDHDIAAIRSAVGFTGDLRELTELTKKGKP